METKQFVKTSLALQTLSYYPISIARTGIRLNQYLNLPDNDTSVFIGKTGDKIDNMPVRCIGHLNLKK